MDFSFVGFDSPSVDFGWSFDGFVLSPGFEGTFDSARSTVAPVGPFVVAVALIEIVVPFEMAFVAVVGSTAKAVDSFVVLVD